ncbi:MAG: hypothetical protein K2K17_12005, partial [Lachnospiraceae bacterium]|nr:hypothetical protein [Lachnospiraceae bacterium]
MKKDKKRKIASTKNTQNEEIMDLDMEDMEWNESEPEDDEYRNDESDNGYDNDWGSDHGYDDRRKIKFGIAAAGTAVVIVLITVTVFLLKSAESSRENMQLQVDMIQNGESIFSGEAGTDNTEAALGNMDSENTDEAGTDKQNAESGLDANSEIQVEVSIGALDDAQDPQNADATGNERNGAEVTVAAINENEIPGVTIGIDVSKYQGTIDWNMVRESGVEFAMIRVGYRAKSTGEIFE